MGYTRKQYEEVMRIYSTCRAENQKKLDQKIKAVYERHPEVRDLKEQMIHNRLLTLQARFSGNADQTKLLESEQKKLQEKKKRLYTRLRISDAAFEMEYDCPDCKDTGFVDGKECACFKRRMTAVMYTESNLKNMDPKADFEHLSMKYYDKEKDGENPSEYERMKTVIEFCKKYSRTFNEKSSDSILFYGPPGAGKTFLANCIAKEVMKKCCSVVYFTAPDFFDTMHEIQFQESDKAKDCYISDCDLLIIDDIGTEGSTKFSDSDLFRVINGRSSRHLPTIISTNLDMAGIAKQYDARIASRIVGSFRIIGLKGRDIRKIKKKEQKDKR